jgi:hypothetical protein
MNWQKIRSTIYQKADSLERVLGGVFLAAVRAEVPREPIRRQTRHLLQGTRLLEQMGCPRDDREMFFRLELVISLPIEFYHHVI